MIEQGSDEWLALRAGKITSSRIKDVMANGKGSAESVTRSKYRAQIVAERLTGESQEDGFENAEMRHGAESEPHARANYEVEFGVEVDQIAFVEHPTIPNAGASPDGLVGHDGCVEIKCPKTATHIRWMIDWKVPEEHVKQMLWVLACTGRQWIDFVSFDDRLKEERLWLFVKRLQRSEYEKEIEAMEKAVRAFDEECAGIVAIMEGA